MAAERSRISSDTDRVNVTFTAAMARMYGLVALGIVTIVVGILVGGSLHETEIVDGSAWVVVPMVIAFIAALFGALYAAESAVRRGNVRIGTAFYLGFAGLLGLFVSLVWGNLFSVIAIPLLWTAALLSLICAIAVTTSWDVLSWRNMLVIGLGGAVISGVVNATLPGLGTTHTVITIILLVIFLGATLRRSRELINLSRETDQGGEEPTDSRLAVQGAINVFRSILAPFGPRV